MVSRKIEILKRAQRGKYWHRFSSSLLLLRYLLKRLSKLLSNWFAVFNQLVNYSSVASKLSGGWILKFDLFFQNDKREEGLKINFKNRH